MEDDISDPHGSIRKLQDRVEALEEVVGLLLQVAREDTVDEIELATIRFRETIKAKTGARKSLGSGAVKKG